MKIRKKIVGITSLTVALLLMSLAYQMNTKILSFPLIAFGLVAAGVLMSEENHWKKGFLWLLFVIVTNLVWMMT